MLRVASVRSWDDGEIHVSHIDRFWVTKDSFGADITTTDVDAYGRSLAWMSTGRWTSSGSVEPHSPVTSQPARSPGRITTPPTTGGGGTDGHLTTLTVRYGALQGAVTVAGDLWGLYAYQGSSAAGTVTVHGNATELSFIGQVSGSLLIDGQCTEIYVYGDLTNADIIAQTLETVVVTGRIRSATPGRVIRATALDSSFSVNDRAAQGIVTSAAGTWIEFDGGNVTAKVQ